MRYTRLRICQDASRVKLDGQPLAAATSLGGVPGLFRHPPYRIDPIAPPEAIVYFAYAKRAAYPPQGARIEGLY
jgi:hypothetical protein